MIGVMKIVGVMVATIFAIALLTRYEPGRLDSRTRIAGLPVVSIAQTDARGVIALGQVAQGVVVIAQGGIGVITIAQGGVGALAGVGQGMVGLLAIAQVGLGVFFFIGQMGGGLQVMGQGVLGKKLSEYSSEMNAEFNELLAFRSPRRPGHDPGKLTGAS